MRQELYLSVTLTGALLSVHPAVCALTQSVQQTHHLRCENDGKHDLQGPPLNVVQSTQGNVHTLSNIVNQKGKKSILIRKNY